MYNTYWRVMEKREIWQHTANSPQSGKSDLLPIIYLAFWKVQKGVMPGVGKMLGYTYTLYDNTFELYWDIVEDRQNRYDELINRHWVIRFESFIDLESSLLYGVDLHQRRGVLIS